MNKLRNHFEAEIISLFEGLSIAGSDILMVKEDPEFLIAWISQAKQGPWTSNSW